MIRLMYTMEPWLKNPSLTLDRLAIVADAICKGRSSAVADFKPGAGDDDWSLGCVAYRRTCHEIRELSSVVPWLRVLNESQALRFTFAIEQTPIRFYVGEPDDIPVRFRSLTGAEVTQMELALKIGAERISDQVLRLAIVKGQDRRVSSIVLAEYDDEGSPMGVFSIPLNAIVNVSNVVSMQRPPVKLAAPSVEPLPNADKMKKDEADDKGVQGSGTI